MISKYRVLAVIVVVLMGAGAVVAQEEDQTPEATAAAESAAAEASPPAEEAEPAPEPKTSFMTTVGFVLDEPVALEGRLLEVEIRDIEFVEKSAMKSGIKGAFNTSNDDLRSEITVRLNMATEADVKQKFDVMIELLDEDGEVIDRTGKDFSFKDNAKVFTFKHTTLKWVVPHVADVRVTAKAKK